MNVHACQPFVEKTMTDISPMSQGVKPHSASESLSYGAEVGKFHSRLLRMPLAVEESREYWEHNAPKLSKKDKEIVAFEQRWFGNKSLSRVRTILRNFSDRFDAYPIALEVLQQWCPAELATRQNICHWHLQLSDPIYRQFSGVFLEQRRTNGQNSIDRDVVMRWIEQQLQKDWSSATTIRMASALITSVTNAGLCSDKTGTRQLIYPQVTDEALTYWLYFLRHLSFAGSLWSNPYFASVGLSGRLLEQRLNRLSDFSFQSIGDVYELDWKYEYLKAWATASLGLNLEDRA